GDAADRDPGLLLDPGLGLGGAVPVAPGEGALLARERGQELVPGVDRARAVAQALAGDPQQLGLEGVEPVLDAGHEFAAVEELLAATGGAVDPHLDADLAPGEVLGPDLDPHRDAPALPGVE